MDEYFMSFCKKTPELWLLNNDVDDTFTCVPSIENVYELELMKKCFENAGINFDTEKSLIQLRDCKQLSNIIIPIDKQDIFLKEYLHNYHNLLHLGFYQKSF